MHLERCSIAFLCRVSKFDKIFELNVKFLALYFRTIALIAAVSTFLTFFFGIRAELLPIRA